MVKTEYPYIDKHGKERLDLIKTYSDQGLSLIQTDTGIVYGDCVIDHISVHHTYIEKEDEAGDLPEELLEPEKESVEA